MKQLFQFAALAVCALLVIGTSSCKKETVEQTAIQNEAIASRVGGPVFEPAKKYTLIKHGNTELTYYGDGKLATMKTLTGTSTYTYGGFGEIYITTKSGNNITGLDTLLTNVGDGKCFYSKTKAISYYANGTITTEKTQKYTYNAAGKLATKYNPAHPNERTEFTYDSDGNLSIEKSYDKNNVKTGQINFYYINSNYQMFSDKYSINPIGIDEPYLAVYGKFAKHLLMKSIHSGTPSGQTEYTYEYTLNVDNYVTERKTYALFAGLIQTTGYSYQVN